MQIAQAKQIPIISILPEPAHKNGTDYWYIAPYRHEKTASLKVNTVKNLWYDFGAGRGGDIIDLVCILKNCSKKEALRYLENLACFSFSPAKNINIQHNDSSDIVIKKVQTIQNRALIDYLHIRKISIDTARKFCKEIYYTVDNKNYFGLGFKNDAGGYEIRNKYAKMNINGKSITTIKSTHKSDTVSIFEGFFDFLSAVEFFKRGAENDVIVLNSLSLLNNINIEYEKILLFLDNDEAGRNAVDKLKREYDSRVIDYSKVYMGYKDFNEFWKSR